MTEPAQATEPSGVSPPPAVLRPALAMRAAWESAVPSRRDYRDVVSELSSLKVVGEGSVFERGPHVPVTNMGYFKPPRMPSSLS